MNTHVPQNAINHMEQYIYVWNALKGHLWLVRSYGIRVETCGALRDIWMHPTHSCTNYMINNN